MIDEKIEKLRQLCIYLCAHSWEDRRVCLDGNESNPDGPASVAVKVQEIMGFDFSGGADEG